MAITAAHLKTSPCGKTPFSVRSLQQLGEANGSVPSNPDQI